MNAMMNTVRKAENVRAGAFVESDQVVAGDGVAQFERDIDHAEFTEHLKGESFPANLGNCLTRMLTMISARQLEKVLDIAPE